MIVAGLVGLVLSFAALRQRDGEASVAVAAHEIRAGEVVGPADFRTERVTMSERTARDRRPRPRRARTTRPHRGTTIAEGELVDRPAAAPAGRACAGCGR